MLKTLASYSRDLLHLFFPAYCRGCGGDLVHQDQLLCLRCLHGLPRTGFFSQPGNPVEKTFYGRLRLEAAGAAWYFTGDSLLHRLVTDLKYHGQQEIGSYLGKLAGVEILATPRFRDIDCIIPLPLNEKKLQQRGYNQAAVIAEGMAAVMALPVLKEALGRKRFTETQTHKDRVSRWQSMQEVFEVKEPSVLENKHILLVDDIVTTGATLEACGTVLSQLPGLRLSIACVGWTI